jgi:peptidoglycan/LPS O-acetylase OafA/YrhL
MLQYVPFFVFGAGLYFATEGLLAGWIAAAASVPAMLYQYFALPVSVPVPDAPPPATWTDLALLVVLFALLVFLAFRRFTGMRRLDRRLGVLTYPLYLYHQDVLVGVLTFTAGYSYFVFAAGMALSIVVSALLCLIIDPVVDYYRDRLRGRSLDGVAIPSQPVSRRLLIPLGGNHGLRGDDCGDHFDQRRQE